MSTPIPTVPEVAHTSGVTPPTGEPRVLSQKELLDEAEKLGVDCTPRMFLRYQVLGLVPKGEIVEGRGMVAYYEYVHLAHLYAIELSKRLGLILKDIDPKVIAAWAKDLQLRGLKKLTSEVIDAFQTKHVKAMTMLFKRQ